MCENPHVIFIRHNMQNKNDGNICERLYNENKIAYHYGEITHNEALKMSKTGNAYKTATIFENADGKLVVAEYTLKKQKHYLLGKVISSDVKNESNEHGCIYKTLKLNIKDFSDINKNGLKDFPTDDFPVYYAVRPSFITCREYGDKYHNHFFEQIIPAVYNNTEFEINVHSLHSSMIEQMCEEYLRQNGIDGLDASELQYDICKVGKDMEKYDIVGVNKKGKIFAQVKADWQESYKDIFKDDKMIGTKIVFADIKENKKIGDVYFISIQTVFNYFKDKNKDQMLKDMAGIAEEFRHLIKITK